MELVLIICLILMINWLKIDYQKNWFRKVTIVLTKKHLHVEKSPIDLWKTTLMIEYKGETWYNDVVTSL